MMTALSCLGTDFLRIKQCHSITRIAGTTFSPASHDIDRSFGSEIESESRLIVDLHSTGPH